MRRIPGKRIIWPQYLDSQRSCRIGRKLPKSTAVPLPSVQELKEAAEMLGYEATINPMARYPKTWWDPPGYLLIDTKGQNKKKVMEKLAKKIIEMRAKKLQMEKQKKAKKSKKPPSKSYKKKTKRTY
ncbi:MAG: signal recognition particle subunit SRP19/SEC65 family protein [Promethearchaeota archaeon]